MAIEKAIYTARARVTGGRVGTAKFDDGQIDLKLDRPIEMGGKGNATNPEQLFGAGYAACFIGASYPYNSKIFGGVDRVRGFIW
jgi:osmotically inducible protein OsmC